MNSMTGFGVARGKVGRSQVLVEARSVNHRFCEVSLRFPGRFASLEPETTRLVRQKFARGKFDLYLREEVTTWEEEEIGQAKKAYQVLKRVQRELGLRGEMTLSDLLTFRQFFTQPVHSPHVDMDQIRPGVLDLFEKALKGLQDMRSREGGRLQKWFLQKGQGLFRLLQLIENHSTQQGKHYRHRLEKRLRGVGASRIHVEEEKLLQEAAMVAERSDVTEEIVRLRSHLAEFRRLLGQKEPLGRKLDFLAQEMGREINTIGSKCQGVRLAHQVIEFKSELERLREQVQNIE